MPRAETAALVAQLTLDDKGFTRGINSAIGKSEQLDSTLRNVGSRAGQGLQSLGRNLAVLGAVGIGGLTVAVKSGLDDLAELENAVTSVDGAIEQLGLTGQLTGKQVADWANDIERDIDAAFDDKQITQAATTLLRFGRVAPQTLEPALRVVADLAAKTGDVESASELLAKALADPTKAAGRLTRVGIILTEQQKDQIKAMTEAGDVAGAQAVLLDAVSKSTAGAAKAMAGPYQDAINKTNDALEDARKALAVGFLPIITKVADKLSDIAADPKALASIEAFGRTLAGGLDSLISTAERLPWEAIGSSLQLAGAGAKIVLDAFVSLPPWVQTAVLTGWGLNKLTGGALGGIVSELGKGLIKGVLGMNAGVVNINAATVNGGGGPGGTAGRALGGLGLAAGGAAAIGVTILGITQGALADFTGSIITGITGDEKKGAAAQQITTSAGGGILPIAGPIDRLVRALQGDFRSGAEVAADQLAETKNVSTHTKTTATEAANTASRQNITNERLEAIYGVNNSAKAEAATRQNIANERLESNRAAVAAAASAAKMDSNSERAAVVAAAARTAEAQRTAAAGVAGAVRGTTAAVNAKDLSVSIQNNVSTSVSVSVRDQVNQFTRFNQYYRTAS